MAIDPFISIDARFWRMLSIRWQREPLSGAGAARLGGRWNRPGLPALYLSADHATAVLEFHQDLVRPGTLATYEVRSQAIVDLTNPAVAERFGLNDASIAAEWRSMVAIQKIDPPGWRAADAMIGIGADGALVPSVQHPGGVNLVLWKWSATTNDGANIQLIDPHGDLK